jgi:hypothetical protein
MGQGETCYNCVYSHWDRNQAAWTFIMGMPVRPACGNQPDFPGRMRTCPSGPVCRNFRPRPPTPTGETVKTIPLDRGFYTYVDAADHEWLSQWKWHLHAGYAARYERHRPIFMHREIMKTPAGMVADHRNQNRLDNTRANLRNCTHQENQQNKAKRQGTSSRFRGVCRYRGRRKWLAKLDWRGQPYYRGYFDEEIEAARAYDCQAVELLGEDAWVNLPEEWPAERRREVHARWLQTESKNKKEEDKQKKGRKKVKAGRPRTGTAGAKIRPARGKAKDTKRKAKPALRKAKGKQRK